MAATKFVSNVGLNRLGLKGIRNDSKIDDLPSGCGGGGLRDTCAGDSVLESS